MAKEMHDDSTRQLALSERDTVVEQFLSRYMPTDAKEYRLPEGNNESGQLVAYRYLQDVANREAAFLDEISHLRFVG